jgi:FKBP-type peptidyl-prolyl cis-trans isomerase FklB
MYTVTPLQVTDKMRRYLYITAVLAFFLSYGILKAEEATRPESEADRISYSLGYQIGNDFKRQGLDLNAEALVSGFNDGIGGGEPVLTREEMDTILGDLERNTSTAQREGAKARRVRKMREAEEKRSKGRAFMAENALKPGVKTLPSGLQYKVIKAGTGKKPGPHDVVGVNYRGKLINGHEFDSSYRRNSPSSFRVGGVIKGWTEALQMMREGAKWELYIPPELAFGRRGPLADQTLIYEIELLGVGETGKTVESKPPSDDQP